MKISEKKKTELYAAIHEPIMEKRVKLLRDDSLLKPTEVDDMLFDLNNSIWGSVRAKLGIDD